MKKHLIGKIRTANPHIGNKIIITGMWDGEPIWRQETAAERLQAEIAKIFK